VGERLVSFSDLRKGEIVMLSAVLGPGTIKRGREEGEGRRGGIGYTA